MKKQNKCIEPKCNNKVSRKNIRCRRCANKGKRNPNYKHGCSNNKYPCKNKDCKNTVGYYSYFLGTGLCKKCCVVGKLNGMYNKKIINTHKTNCQCCFCRVIRKEIDMSGANNPFYNKRHTKEFKKNHSNRMKQENHPFWNKKRPKHSEWMKNNYKKFVGEQFLNPKGKNNGNYQHGLSHYPYPLEFNNKLKEFIRSINNYTCQNCNVKESKNLKLYNRKLDVHHIDYNKQNCNLDNLISLCRSCNGKVNKNRDYWYAYFTYIIKYYFKNYNEVKKWLV